MGAARAATRDSRSGRRSPHAGRPGPYEANNERPTPEPDPLPAPLLEGPFLVQSAFATEGSEIISQTTTLQARLTWLGAVWAADRPDDPYCYLLNAAHDMKHQQRLPTSLNQMVTVDIEMWSTRVGHDGIQDRALTPAASAPGGGPEAGPAGTAATRPDPPSQATSEPSPGSDVDTQCPDGTSLDDSCDDSAGFDAFAYEDWMVIAQGEDGDAPPHLLDLLPAAATANEQTQADGTSTFRWAHFPAHELEDLAVPPAGAQLPGDRHIFAPAETSRDGVAGRQNEFLEDGSSAAFVTSPLTLPAWGGAAPSLASSVCLATVATAGCEAFGDNADSSSFSVSIAEHLAAPLAPEPQLSGAPISAAAVSGGGSGSGLAGDDLGASALAAPQVPLLRRSLPAGTAAEDDFNFAYPAADNARRAIDTWQGAAREAALRD